MTSASKQPIVLDSTANFMLVVDVLKHRNFSGMMGYRILNLNTGVCEAEGQTEASARMTLYQFQKHLDYAKSGVWKKAINEQYDADLFPNGTALN